MDLNFIGFSKLFRFAGRLHRLIRACIQMEHAFNLTVLKAKTNRLYLEKIGRNVTTVAKLITLKGV